MLTAAAWLEQSRLAAWVNSSPLVLGALSGLHLIGFTLVLGTALVGGLSTMGLAFRREPPLREVLARAGRMVFVGLLVSVVTGALLVSPRAGAALGNWIFDLKITLIAAALVAQIVVGRFTARAAADAGVPLRACGVMAMTLWLAAGVAGCAFILLE